MFFGAIFFSDILASALFQEVKTYKFCQVDVVYIF
jgi:hypothetical protein